MRKLQIKLTDQEYYKLVEQAARNQKDVGEYVKELAVSEIEGDTEVDLRYDTFDKYVTDKLDLKQGTTTAVNVIRVVELIREGLSWTDAVQKRAEEYASGNPKIQSPETYSDTVRDCCTRRLELSTVEFKKEARRLIQDYGEEISEVATPRKQAAAASGYIAHISDAGNRLETFGDEEGKDQAEVMAEVVNYLIEEHGLIEIIEPLPYVVQTKALINDQPTYPDGEEQMRHYKELTGGYYLDTHYQKGDKKLRLEDLAEKCGLGMVTDGNW